MPENEEIINYIKRAFELKSQECYKQAIEMLYKALAIEPDNKEILFQIGELYFLLHNYARAVQYPKQILLSENNHIPSLRLLKNIYIKENELFAAKETAEKLYELEPDNYTNLVSLIDLCGKLDLLEDIHKYSEKIKKNDRCLYACAEAYYKKRILDKAEDYIKKALVLNPDNEDCIVLSGKILFDNNEFEKAKELFEKLGNNTHNAEILNYQGLFALEEMRFIDAIKNFSKAANIDKKNSIYFYNLGNAYFLNGWKDEAVDAYKNAIRISPDNLDYRYSLGYLYYEYKEYEKARSEVDYILNNKGTHYHARVLKALLKYEDKCYLEAEKILYSNIQDGFKDDFTLSTLSKIELELGKFEAAEKHLLEVIETKPENLSYQCELGEVYIKEKKFNAAIEIANEVIKKNSNYICGYILGAKAALMNKDLEISKGFAQTALSLDINCAEGYYYLALVRLEEKDFDEAIECMKRAITFDVNNARYYAAMAEIYKCTGDSKTAFDYVKEAENIDDSEEYKILYREYAALNRK